MLIIDYNITPERLAIWCRAQFIPSTDEWPIKNGKYTTVEFPMQPESCRQWLYKNTKWQSARFGSFLSKEACSTSWNNIICGAPSEVLHFPYFSLTLANFPPPTGSPDRQAFFMSGKASHRFFLQSHTDHRKRPRLLATNHKITVDFLGNRTNYLVDRKDGGVLFIRGYWWGYITPWCPWGLTKTSLDDIAGWQMMSPSCMYYLTDQYVNTIKTP